MLPTHPLMACLATCDAQRSRQFFEGTLGLTFVSDDPFALVFEANGTSVRIQKVGSFAPQPFTVLGWRVPDLASVVDGLAGRGVQFERFEGMGQDARGIWTSPGGALVAWFKDPDGNTLSLTQV